MTKESYTVKAYELAKERYAQLGIDVDKALEQLQKISISIHCWQADDVSGFENPDGDLTGGIQATGNYPGKARTMPELFSDIEKALSLIPGKHRLNVHAIYGDFAGKKVDRDEIEPKHFQTWIDWAKKNEVKLDFNCTCFSHPKSAELTLSSRDKAIRDFWIEHVKRCRFISDEMGKQLGSPAMHNLWIPDGTKDQTVDRYLYRQFLTDSLDQIFATPYSHMKDSIESKLFGIGAESCTIGSHDFYMGYGVKNNKIVTLDTGHFHPTEVIADKISALLLFTPEIMLHVSRGIRWDSDHVTILNDETLFLAQEIVRANALPRVNIGLDYFDASINRIGAYVIGTRSTQKAFLNALLEPIAKLREYEKEGRYFERLALLEEAKALPWEAVWDYFCLNNNVPVAEAYIAEIQRYEKQVLSAR